MNFTQAPRNPTLSTAAPATSPQQGISPGVRMLMQRMQPNQNAAVMPAPVSDQGLRTPGAPGARMVSPMPMQRSNMAQPQLQPQMPPQQPRMGSQELPPDLQRRLGVFRR